MWLYFSISCFIVVCIEELCRCCFGEMRKLLFFFVGQICIIPERNYGRDWHRSSKHKVGFKTSRINDYTKDGGEKPLPRCIASELRIVNDSIGIQLKNAMHLGKKFLIAMFTVQ